MTQCKQYCWAKFKQLWQSVFQDQMNGSLWYIEVCWCDLCSHDLNYVPENWLIFLNFSQSLKLTHFVSLAAEGGRGANTLCIEFFEICYIEYSQIFRVLGVHVVVLTKRVQMWFGGNVLSQVEIDVARGSNLMSHRVYSVEIGQSAPHRSINVMKDKGHTYLPPIRTLCVVIHDHPGEQWSVFLHPLRVSTKSRHLGWRPSCNKPS